MAGKAAAYKRIAVIMALLLLAGFMPACERQRSAVVFAGSTSVQPYVEILSEDYAILHPGPDSLIDVQPGGSAAAIKSVASGIADIGMLSRELKDTEKEQVSYVIEIAKDGLAIIVNPKNPIVGLTLEEYRKIYTREITNWSELGGRDAEIHIVTREDGSGTRDVFAEKVMGKEYEISPKAIVQDSNGAMKQIVSNDKNAIGFISLGLVDDTVKALQVNGIAATRENVINGSYFLFRPFILVAVTEPTGAAKAFIDFILSGHGQAILVNEGLIPE